MGATKGLVALAVAFLAIAPTLIAGGRLIVAFMVGKGILPLLMQTVLCMGVLVPSGIFAAHMTEQDNSLYQVVVSSMVLLAPTWVVYVAFEFWAKKRPTTS